MSQLIESIRLNDGQFNNLKYHEQRMDCSLKELYNIDGRSDLNHFFRSIEYPRKGLYKCRLLYDNQSKSTEFVPYTIKRVKSLKLIVDNDILYNHKYLNRAPINKLFEKRDNCDDILIIKNGGVTDSSYANIVFNSGDKWYTPQTYLLKGTMRESLIQSGEIKEEQIKSTDIMKFKKFKLINSMLGFETMECDISTIF